MKQNKRLPVTVLLLAIAFLAACGPASPPAAPGPTGGTMIRGQAVVEEIDILIMESFPVQVRVVARGNLPDGCTQIDEIRQDRAGQAFQITVTTVRPADALCTEALVPFEQSIALEVVGLQAGPYTVNANGIAGGFILAVDNVMPTEPGPSSEFRGTQATS